MCVYHLINVNQNGFYCSICGDFLSEDAARKNLKDMFTEDDNVQTMMALLIQCREKMKKSPNMLG
jgi:hypothetical protein